MSAGPTPLPAAGSIPRSLCESLGNRPLPCPARDAGRPALTCAGGRAALSPGPPGSGARVWGRWTCPPETCPPDRTRAASAKAHSRSREEGEGAPSSQPCPGNRELKGKPVSFRSADARQPGTEGSAVRPLSCLGDPHGDPHGGAWSPMGARPRRRRSPGAGGHSAGSSLVTVQPLGKDLAPVAPLPRAALSRRLVLARGHRVQAPPPAKEAPTCSWRATKVEGAGANEDWKVSGKERQVRHWFLVGVSILHKRHPIHPSR